MPDHSLSPAEIVALEHAGLEAWADLFRAVPPAFTRAYRPEWRQEEGVHYTRCRAIPFAPFNTIHDLGLTAPATEPLLDQLLAAYAAVGIARFEVTHHAGRVPDALPRWFQARQLHPRGALRRYYALGGPARGTPGPAPQTVMLVDQHLAPRWTTFLDRWYELPTGAWFRELVGRRGWLHAVLLREGEVQAARSLYLSPGREGWLGLEAPVPGLMTPAHADDDLLLRHLLAEARRREARITVLDAIARGDDGPRWQQLGLRPGYERIAYGPAQVTDGK